jgi:hypothetical protein
MLGMIVFRIDQAQKSLRFVVADDYSLAQTYSKIAVFLRLRHERRTSHLPLGYANLDFKDMPNCLCDSDCCAFGPKPNENNLGVLSNRMVPNGGYVHTRLTDRRQHS